MTSVQSRIESDDRLNQAFNLPATMVEDFPELAEIHDEIVTRMKAEAHGMPMNTVQNLLLERIAYNYVFLKYRELRGETSGREQKDLNSFWLSMTQEFNRLLSVNEAERRDQLMTDVVDVFQEAIALIQDQATRQAVSQSVSAGLAKKGL